MPPVQPCVAVTLLDTARPARCLPPGPCRYDWSQQYGSIGWSVGATLGMAVAGKDAGRRVLACIGDGSFQMTAQVSPLFQPVGFLSGVSLVSAGDGSFLMMAKVGYSGALVFVSPAPSGSTRSASCRWLAQSMAVAGWMVPPRLPLSTMK